MIRHLLKLVWNRKGSNFLIVLEIFASFLVVFSLTAAGIQLYATYSEPLGFQWQDVWTVDVNRNVAGGPSTWSSEDAATFKRLLSAAAELPEVVSIAAASTIPYNGSTDNTAWEQDGRRILTEYSDVTPEAMEVLQLELVAGRWFTAEDVALDWTPVVIDQELARELVGDGDPLGTRLKPDPENNQRIVGIVRDYRRQGELTMDGSYTFSFASLDGPKLPPTLRTLMIRLVPGTTAAFEEPLAKVLQAAARSWSFQVVHLGTARARHLRQNLLPLGAVGVVAGFLLAMVVLGLTGVLWQNVTRRTREFGLRRATGAHRARIHRQIVGEVMITAGVGLVAGSFLALQVPLVGPFTFISFAVVVPALLLAAMIILLLTAACGLYPGWTATRIQPAEALHYE